MKTKKKENIVIIVILVIMLIAIIGVSYAAFSFSKQGNVPNKITTGSITMTYTESSNTISLGNALPTTDKTGTTRLKEGEYFDFTVSSEIVGDVNINYEISAKEIGDGTIDGSNIKLYLTEIVDGEEQSLMSPEVYNEETSENTYTGRPANEMSLYTSSMNASEEHNYRLRMYVTEEYNPQGDGGGLTFTVKVNVYGKAGDKPLTGGEMLIEKANPEDLEYDSATSEQQKEMWTFTHPATEQTEALTDYRYIGTDPNNYVEFNDELWRIIGVFTVDDGTGNKEERLKIIRNEPINSGGYGYSWSSSLNDSNNWLSSQLNYLLNPGHENETYGKSLYWNKTSGTCLGSPLGATYGREISCDFTSIGLNDNSKNMIGDSLWYLGGLSNIETITPIDSYKEERGINGINKNWTGKVGLMYPSDYGYASSDEMCLNSSMYRYSDCINWMVNIFDSQLTWTITSIFDEPYPIAIDPYRHDGGGRGIDLFNSYRPFYVNPVVFLKPSVKIIDGDGSSSNPYILS